MDLISIIVPVYKSELYLECCIKSLINQTYKNIEIILVEDGSPDRCAAICDKWANIDNRIKVIHKKNGGSAQARNVGLHHACGNYIGFVDSDDFIFPEMYQILLNQLYLTGADIAECDFYNVNSSDFPKAEGISNNGFCLNVEQALQGNICDTVCRQLVWNKLYSKRVIEGIQFVEQKYIDDEFFTYRVLAQAKKISVIPTKLYCYRQQSESVMHQRYSIKRLDVIEAKQWRMNLLEDKYPRLVNLAQKEYFFACIYHGQKSLLCLSGEERKEAVRLLRGAFRKYSMANLLKAKELSIYDKCWLYLGRTCFKVTCWIRNSLRIGL